jgi:hypothetical protein
VPVESLNYDLEEEEVHRPVSITNEANDEQAVRFLRVSNSNSNTTERQIRTAVETKLGCDLSERRLFIRSAVTSFLGNSDLYANVGVNDAARGSTETNRRNAAAELAARAATPPAALAAPTPEA